MRLTQGTKRRLAEDPTAVFALYAPCPLCTCPARVLYVPCAVIHPPTLERAAENMTGTYTSCCRFPTIATRSLVSGVQAHFLAASLWALLDKGPLLL